MATTDVGKRVRLLCEIAGISARELGRRAGVTGQTVSNTIRGDRGEPSLSTVVAISRACGVPVQWLIEGGDQPTREHVRAALALDGEVRS